MHVCSASVIGQPREQHIFESMPVIFEQEYCCLARKQCNFRVRTQLATCALQHCLPLESCVSYMMLAPSAQRVAQVPAMHCSIPDVALYAQAPPSRNVQIFVESIGGSPESHRIQWVGHYAFSCFLLNHPFIVLEIGVFIFNARCKKRSNG